MTLYLLKVVLGSGLIWLVYHFWLQNAKMFHFNRAYLILGLLGAYCVPLLPLHRSALEPGEMIVWVKPSTKQLSDSVLATQGWEDLLPMLPFVIWMIGSLLFLLRFGKNLLDIWQSVRQKAIQNIGAAKLIFLPDEVAPHSFGPYIFLSAADRERLDPVLLTHEMAHVEQRHSWDILFVELLIVLSWFNPFVYLFRRSIRLNHEFLADEAVLQTHNNRQTYPYLILERASGQQALTLGSAFHYNKLKKRLSMITKSRSLGQIRLKQLSLIPLFGAFLMVFAGEAIAQTPPPPPPPTEQIPPPPPPKVADADRPPPPPPVSANFSFDKPGYQGMKIVLKGDNGKKTVLRFEDMTDDQKRQYLPPPPPPPAMRVPSNDEFASWRNANEYGVWLDGKQISNSELANYQASEIADYQISKLTKTAKNYGKHTYQLTAWTEKGFEKMLKEWHNNWGD
ncbi:MAG: M56 family metallopeptidase [Bacteroidia bacterium]